MIVINVNSVSIIQKEKSHPLVQCKKLKSYGKISNIVFFVTRDYFSVYRNCKKLGYTKYDENF